MRQQVIREELSREESQQYLALFQKLEYKSRLPSTDWYGGDDASFYIWAVDITDGEKIPIGFIGYDLFALSKDEEFIYIVKFFVLGEYKKYYNKSVVKLIEGEKLSSILFKEIIAKGKNIITLTFANEKLKDHYNREFGFIHNKEISEKLADIVGTTSDDFLYLEVNK